MLIYLNAPEYPRDAAAFKQWQKNDPTVLRFWERLAEVIGDSRHAVFAPKRLFDWANELSGLSDTQRGALCAMRDSLTADAHYFLGASSVLVLTGPDRAMSLKHPNLGRHHRRDWSWLAQRKDTLQCAALVAENLNDSKFFVWIARAMGARLRPTDINEGDEVALECVAGGGSTTGQVYESKVQQGFPALCVVDADKKYPDGDPGDTASGVAQAERRLSAHPKNPPHEVVTLDAYTIENVVPLELVREACPKVDWVEPMARRGFFLQQVSTSEGSVSLAYVDPALKYVKPEKASANELLGDAGQEGGLREYRENAIQLIRGRDSDAPTEDDQVLVLSVGKLPNALVQTLDVCCDHKRRPGEHDSVAHWLCSLLLASPDSFAKEWEPVARAVWSWGLCFRPRIRSR
jgi:hypothetical protein